jgi:hypothetical protein
MSYDVLIEFPLGIPREAVEAVLVGEWGDDAFHRNGEGPAWYCDRWLSSGIFFTIDVAAASKRDETVKMLSWNLCFGGTTEEAAFLARSIGVVAEAFSGVIHDPQVGAPVTPDEAESRIVSKWAEANRWSLGNYESGDHIVRDDAGLVKGADGRVVFIEAIRTDARAENLKSVACCHGRAGDFERLKRVCERVLSEYPDDAVAHYLLGTGLKELGDLVGAERSFRRALEIEPSHAGAQDELDELTG